MGSGAHFQDPHDQFTVVRCLENTAKEVAIGILRIGNMPHYSLRIMHQRQDFEITPTPLFFSFFLLGPDHDPPNQFPVFLLKLLLSLPPLCEHLFPCTEYSMTSYHCSLILHHYGQLHWPIPMPEFLCLMMPHRGRT